MKTLYSLNRYPSNHWEGGQAHLSAESALYCRVVTEGLFGITPTGFRSFRCTPRLTAAWPEMKLSQIKAFGNAFDLVARREGKIKDTRQETGDKRQCKDSTVS